MKRLYTKLFLGIIVSLIASVLCMIILVRPGPNIFQNRVLPHLIGGGLGILRSELSTKTWKEAQATLTRWKPQSTLSLQLIKASKQTLYTRLKRSRKMNGVYIDRIKSAFVFYLPVPRASAFLKIGPLHAPAPPWSTFLMLFCILMLFILLFLSIPIVPIVRRLRALQRATQEVGEGHWKLQVQDTTQDAIGQLARSFNQMTTKLQQLFQDREELLQAVSHELGTPLSRMRLSLEMLKTTKDPKRSQRHISSLDLDLTELEHLGSELVDWVQADAPHLNTQSIRIVEVLEQLVDYANEDSDVELRLEHQIDKALSLQVEPRQFRRAIENLMRNAIRYATKLVILEARVEGGSLLIEVRDDGPGIPEDQRADIFEPFVRLDSTPTQKGSGLGLGLAIVHRIVTRHKGKIIVLQEHEGGACFRSTWPL